MVIINSEINNSDGSDPKEIDPFEYIQELK